MSGTKTCNQCGEILAESGAAFCSACGARVDVAPDSDGGQLHPKPQASDDGDILGLNNKGCLVFGLLFLFFFPLAWLPWVIPDLRARGKAGAGDAPGATEKPNGAAKWLAIGCGGIFLLLVIMVVLGSMIENQARQEIRDAHHQWDEGDRSGAIAAYRDLYRTRFTVAGSDAKLVARLADAAMEQGDAGRSGELLQRVIELHADKFLEREDSLAKAAEIREKQEERHRLLAEKRAREREAQAEEARIEAAAKELVELGEKSRGPKPQQSAWDGVPTAVRAWMEKNANDPDSIEYIETSDLVPMGFVWVARVKYRGTNAFGGKVVEERYFHIVGDDMGGTVVEVRKDP